MTEYELTYIVQYCEEMVQAVGVLTYDTARTCMYAYESLKQLVANGDYLVFREWWDQNAINILKEGKPE